MKFFTSVVLLSATVTASPVPRIFNLISSNASDESHNGLYLSTQHVDPLNSKAVFRDAADAAEFYFLDGTVRYNAPNGAPYAMALVSGDEVQSEVEIGVSPSSGSTGFSLASDDILATDNENWGGWLVCDGASDLPGLYYHNKSNGGDVPGGCDPIELDAVYKDSS
ncbi:hypothetical protein BDV38DRAFT_234011 [Aspergillus pseudotamarii]|uniref:DUF7907 domain-containing protein n=1 Tax=Aspergillus pseudotamarii TaxID=132259 RepID=A0A5N6T9A8_ASPPS|nr:uncharacterized protein BDV38DRAFT_234011 [Aspergillus pseudotamarii]KAE8142761.1 hypothetical protein BDV38DRAFT_234011 [Aspergillus pseudotamarii]